MSTKLKIMLKERTLPFLYFTIVIIGALMLAQDRSELLTDWGFYLGYASLLVVASIASLVYDSAEKSYYPITSRSLFVRYLLYRLITAAVMVGVLCLAGTIEPGVLTSPWFILIWLGGALTITLLELLIDRA